MGHTSPSWNCHLKTVTLAVGALGAVMSLFGKDLPPAIKTTVKVVMALNAVMVIANAIKKIATAVETVNTGAKIANTTATEAETAAKAAQAAAALASVGIFIALAAAAYGVFLLLPKLFSAIRDAAVFLGKFAAAVAKGIFLMMKAIVKFGVDLILIVPRILAGILGAIAKGVGGIFKGIGNFFGGIFKGIGSIFGLAEGGLVKKPTFAMVGEGGQDEVIMPLNAGTMRMLGNAIVAAQGGRNSMVSAHGLLAKGGTTIMVNVNASDPTLINELRSEVERSVIRVVKRNTIGMGGIA
jgi:hypothetical protein